MFKNWMWENVKYIYICNIPNIYVLKDKCKLKAMPTNFFFCKIIIIIFDNLFKGTILKSARVKCEAKLSL